MGFRLAKSSRETVPQSCRSLRSPAGFTLLEVLVSLTVLAISATLALSLISGSLGNIRKVQTRIRLVEHANAVMELTLLDASIRGPKTFTGYFDDGTHWSVQVTEYAPPDAPELPAAETSRTPSARLLHYTVDMFQPDSRASNYRLQTLKLVGTESGANPTAGLPQ